MEEKHEIKLEGIRSYPAKENIYTLDSKPDSVLLRAGRFPFQGRINRYMENQIMPVSDNKSVSQCEGRSFLSDYFPTVIIYFSVAAVVHGVSCPPDFSVAGRPVVFATAVSCRGIADIAF